MEFVKYQHVEKIGTDEVEGIENGICYIFPKIDGTNSSLWMDNGVLKAGSRNRELTLLNDNGGFYAWALEQESIKKFFGNNPDCRLFGEWLIPHTLKTYRNDAWRKFYVFDVLQNDSYILYEDYKITLDNYEIDYIPALCKIENPRPECLIGSLERNQFLIKDGEGQGEGIVIKNYDYRNKFGRKTWAKIVSTDFKDKHTRDWKVTELQQEVFIEEAIVEKYVNETLVEKEYSKIAVEGWKSQYIPRLLSTVFYCLINEEMWNILKDFKNPKIDFKYLHLCTTRQIKKIKKELF